MSFDLNEQGNIISSPLAYFESAIVADAGCLLRLVLARPQDQPQTDSIAVQLTMRAEQMESLGGDLQKMLDLIATSKRTAH
jgi:hypothetical protein